MSSRRLFDWICLNGHTFEAFAYPAEYQIPCGVCQGKADRQVSAPNIKLEGITGAFPTAYDAWTRQHEQGAKRRREREE